MPSQLASPTHDSGFNYSSRSRKRNASRWIHRRPMMNQSKPEVHEPTHPRLGEPSFYFATCAPRETLTAIGCLDNVADDEDDDVPRLSAFYLMFRVPLQFPLGDDPWIRLVSRYAYCISFNARELIRRRHAREVPGRRLPRAVSAFVRSPRLKASQGIRALEAVIFECTLSGPRNVHARSLRPYLRANKTYRRRGITSHVKAVLLKSVLIQWDADGLFVKYAEPFQVRRDRAEIVFCLAVDAQALFR